MAEEYVIVDKADLETIANSVREKTSTIDKYSVAALAEAMASTIVPPLPVDSPGNKQLVTDSTGKTKWIDLYCSKEESFITLLEEQTIDFSSDFDIGFPLYSYDNYTIYVDGTEYNLTRYYEEIIPGEIGYHAVDAEDGTFSIHERYMHFEDGGVHTVKIGVVSETIKTLDDKFISDSISRIDDVAWDKIPGKPNINNGSGTNSITEGRYTTASGSNSHAEGYGTTASGSDSHAEGSGTTASGYESHAEGSYTTASGGHSHSEGCRTAASGVNSHAEGGNIGADGISMADRIVGSDTITGLTSELTIQGPMAYGLESHAEGTQTLAYMYASHAEGAQTIASGAYSHAEGSHTTASGGGSHAEGSFTTASGEYSHAEGSGTTAFGNGSHAEGGGTTASWEYSHAEGYSTTASVKGSHAEGYKTIAASDYQHVQGKFNIEDADNKYAHIVGNGTRIRSNAHTLDWDGNAWYAGTVEGTAMIVKSSTAYSTKRFKITVDDSGTISATEITT